MDRETVVRRVMTHRPMFVGFILSIVRDYHMAEDVYQETMVRAIEHSDTFENEAHLLAWVRKVARNESIELLRRKNREPVMLNAEVLDLVESEWSRMTPMSSQDMAQALEHCLKQLTQRSRRLIEMRYAQSLTGHEIARVTDRKPQSVYQTLHRVYRKLNDCIQRQTASRGAAS